jgi:hypothetical protein
MKAILEFDLDNPDDLESYTLCNNASNMYSCLNDFDQKLRSICKHSDDEAACNIRELFYEYLNEHNIKL